jgi:hypothetical protein
MYGEHDHNKFNGDGAGGDFCLFLEKCNMQVSKSGEAPPEYVTDAASAVSAATRLRALPDSKKANVREKVRHNMAKVARFRYIVLERDEIQAHRDDEVKKYKRITKVEHNGRFITAPKGQDSMTWSMIKSVYGEPGVIQTRVSGCGCKPCFKLAGESRECLHDPAHVDGWARRPLELKSVSANAGDDDDSEDDDDGDGSVVIRYDAALFQAVINEAQVEDVLALNVRDPATQHTHPYWLLLLSKLPYKLTEPLVDSKDNMLAPGVLVVEGQFLEHAPGSHCTDRDYVIHPGVAIMPADVESISKVFHVGVDLVRKGRGAKLTHHVARDIHEILSAKIDRDPDDYGDETRVGANDVAGGGDAGDAADPQPEGRVNRFGRTTGARYRVGDL